MMAPVRYQILISVLFSAETFFDETKTLTLLKLKISTLYFMNMHLMILHLEFNKTKSFSLT